MISSVEILFISFTIKKGDYKLLDKHQNDLIVYVVLIQSCVSYDRPF